MGLFEENGLDAELVLLSTSISIFREMKRPATWLLTDAPQMTNRFGNLVRLGYALISAIDVRGVILQAALDAIARE